MNELTIAQKLIGFLGCGVLSVGVVALLVVNCREQLLSVLERFSGLNAFARVMACGALVMLTMYGGAKHYMPTNTPPDDVSSPTNTPMLCAGPLRGRGLSQTSQLGQTNAASGGLGNPAAPVMLSLPPSTSTLNLNLLTNWTARGAYCDWKPITFSDGFRFPVGTNFIDGVTLFAWGEVRVKSKSRVEVEQRNLSSDSSGQPERESTNLCSTSTSCFDYSLPARVSLEPNVSSVTHGLTPSNSYLFAWHNACVERCATNRADASIELFRSGAVAITMQPTNQPPTTIYQPPILPEGIIGNGQDEAWIRANFPDEADHILAMGYENWLLNEYVGINEENGHFQTAITVASLPADGGPCYLACGPYKVNVTAAGTYRFPLEVFETYTVSAYPSNLRLSYEHDDGYRGAGTSFEIIEPDSASPAPRPRLMGSPISQLPLSVILSDLYRFYMNPTVVPLPDFIYLEDGHSERVQFWCNMLWVSRTFYWANYARIAFHGRSEAVVLEALEAEVAYIGFEFGDKLALGLITIEPAPSNDSTNSVPERVDADVFNGDDYHSEQTNDMSIVSVTAVTETGSTNEVLATGVSVLGRGRSYYVGVFMATSEEVLDIQGYNNDSVSWQVLSNGSTILAGETDVCEQAQAIESAYSWTNRLYGFTRGPVYLGGCSVTAPSDGQLNLRLVATAQNEGDGLRQTCLQIAVFPIDENGTVVGWPQWVNRN